MNPPYNIKFIVRGDPKAQKRHRSGRGYHYDPSKGDKADFLLLAHKHIPKQPIEGPIFVKVRYYMPIPTSWPKYRKKAAENDLLPHIKTPDLDNLVKFTLDALAPYWVDDRQVYLMDPCKYYSPTPRTEVTIRPDLPDPNQ